MYPAVLTNINPTELILIAIVAVLAFGRRLPEVAGRAAGYVQRARRALNQVRRESGLEEELASARRAMNEVMHPSELRDLPKLESPAKTVGRMWREPSHEGLSGGVDGSTDPSASPSSPAQPTAEEPAPPSTPPRSESDGTSGDQAAPS